MSHIWMSHVTRINESCHTYECVMSSSWMGHVTYKWNWSRLTQVQNMSYIWHKFFSHECRTSSMPQWYSALTWDTTHLYMWHIHHTCATQHTYFICVTWRIHSRSHIQGCHSLFVVSSFACTGWRRLIGSPKSQIIFHKRATRCTSLLRKMTYTDKGSYESSQPCKCSMPSSC